MLICVAIGCVSAYPPIPVEFYGKVSIDGAPAPVGTTIAAFIDGYECGSITTTTIGMYGSAANFQNRLIVQGRDTDGGKTITFRINGVVAGETATFSPGVSQSRDLTIVTGISSGTNITPIESTNNLEISGLHLTPSTPGASSSAVVSIADLETGGSHVSMTGTTVTITTPTFTLTMPSADEIREDNNNGTLSFTPQSIHMETKPITANVNTVGEVTATVQADLNSIPSGAKITTSISSEPTSAISSAFQLAATGNNLQINDVAYTLNVTRENIVDGTDIASATISMSISPDWVTSHGGVSAIRIIRTSGDGTNEVLDTTFAGFDSAGRMNFEGISVHGLSTFGLAATTPTVSAPPSGSTSGSHGGGTSSGFTSSYFTPSTPGKPGQPKIYIGTGTLDMVTGGNSLDATLSSQTTIISKDSAAALTLNKGIMVKDRAGKPVSSISITPVVPADLSLPTDPRISFTGYAYEFSPDDTVFTPAAILVFSIPKDKWNTLNLEQLSVRQYNSRSGSWDPVDTRVNSATQSVTASITHFTTFGLFEVRSSGSGSTHANTVPVTTGDTGSKVNPVKGPTTSGMSIPIGFNPLLVGIGAVVIIIVGVAVVQVHRNRAIDSITLLPFHSHRSRSDDDNQIDTIKSEVAAVISEPSMNITESSTENKIDLGDISHLMTELALLKVEIQHKNEVIDELKKEREWLRQQVTKLHEIVSQNKKS